MQVISISVTNGGKGYKSAPVVSLSGGGGMDASATAVIDDGVVDAVEIDDGGSGYTAAPDVAFSGGGGKGAAAVATVG